MDEELEIAKGSPLKLLTEEDLVVHSVEILKIRIETLNQEVVRTKAAIKDKESASNAANSIFS
ncbi:MAG: DUF1192 family protein [Kordiimonadaceae bacterium]|jgi:uncharacterized small protein (DUF1192 family)|nr:DUF1192 family protein [Kordiimonadaceae bacterium]